MRDLETVRAPNLDVAMRLPLCCLIEHSDGLSDAITEFVGVLTSQMDVGFDQADIEVLGTNLGESLPYPTRCIHSPSLPSIFEELNNASVGVVTP